MAIVTCLPFIHIFKPILRMALDDHFTKPSPDCLVNLFDAINAVDLSRAPFLARDEKLSIYTSAPTEKSKRDEARPTEDSHSYSTSITYMNRSLPLEVPLFLNPGEVGDVSSTCRVAELRKSKPNFI